MLWLLLPLLTAATLRGPTSEQRQMISDIGAGSVLAWAEHITGQDPNDLTSFDKFESVAVIPGTSNRANGDARTDDEVWVSTRRDVNGVWVRYVEQFQPLDWGPDPNYCWFVDCAWNAAATGGDGGEGAEAVYRYPVLQELTDAEIPDAPAAPADTALVNPISVTTAKGLASMTPGNHYSIDADINLTGVSWTPLTWNSANPIVIEGNGHTISNLSISSSGSDYRGLIGYWQGSGGGEIRNLNFSNCSTYGRNYTGILTTRVVSLGDIVIHDVNFTDCTVRTGNTKAGMMGSFYTSGDLYIYDCTATDCTATSTDTTPLGTAILFSGLAASEDTAGHGAYISNCHVVGGSVNLTTDQAGNVGVFCAQMDSGANTGAPNLHLYGCSTSGNLTVTAPNTSTPGHGPIGQFASFLNNVQCVSCSASGTLTLGTNANFTTAAGRQLESIGGFAGDLNFQTECIDCTCTGSIVLPDDGGSLYLWNIGNFAGAVEGGCHFLRCYSTGDLTCPSDTGYLRYVGGFAGQILSGDGVAERCWCEGDLNFTGTVNAIGSTHQYVGGFVGLVGTAATAGEATCVNCYSWSSIAMSGGFPAAELYVGGFLGSGLYSDTDSYSVGNCYVAQTDTAAGSGYTGQIPATAKAFGFGSYDDYDTGDDTTTIFWDTTTSSLSDTNFGEGHPVLWMMTKQNYVDAGWDFSTIWYIPDPNAPATPEAPDGSQLDARAVCVYADAISRGTFTMDGNDITDFNEADYSVIIAGLNYFSILETTDLHRLSTLGKNAMIKTVQGNFYDTLGVHVGYDKTYSADWRFFKKDYLMKSGAARNIGGGIVGLPYSGEPFAAGEEIYLYGTTNYNGIHTLAADTNNVELRITAPYVAETFDGSEWVVSNTPPELFSGYKGPAPFLRGTNRKPKVYLWLWDPVPLTLRSLTADMELTLE